MTTDTSLSRGKKMETYYEVRTASGVVVQQFTTVAVMERWFQRRKNFDYLPSYQIFKITKQEELVSDLKNCPATTN